MSHLFPTFIELPQIAKFHRFTSQSKNSAFLLACHVMKGEKPLKFEWFKDDHKIASELIDPGRYQIDTKNTFSLFTLNQIETVDAGNYSCVVSNPFGLDAQWSVLQVKGMNFLILI